MSGEDCRQIQLLPGPASYNEMLPRRLKFLVNKQDLKHLRLCTQRFTLQELACKSH